MAIEMVNVLYDRKEREKLGFIIEKCAIEGHENKMWRTSHMKYHNAAKHGIREKHTR